MKKSITCNGCGITFERETGEINRSLKKDQLTFCSRQCSSRYGRAGFKHIVHQANVICALCNKPFYLSFSKIKNSKSGLHFCSRAHKDQAQRIGGIQEIMPPHYGTALKQDCRVYRTIAKAHHSQQCIECGYNEVPEIL